MLYPLVRLALLSQEAKNPLHEIPGVRAVIKAKPRQTFLLPPLISEPSYSSPFLHYSPFSNISSQQFILSTCQLHAFSNPSFAASYTNTLLFSAFSLFPFVPPPFLLYSQICKAFTSIPQIHRVCEVGLNLGAEPCQSLCSFSFSYHCLLPNGFMPFSPITSLIPLSSTLMKPPLLLPLNLSWCLSLSFMEQMQNKQVPFSRPSFLLLV